MLRSERKVAFSRVTWTPLPGNPTCVTVNTDKIEDAKAKAAIKAQIEADKRERAEKAAREKALRQGTQLPASQPPLALAASASSSTAGKDYKETRLQVLTHLLKWYLTCSVV